MADNRQLILLQRMEMALVRAIVENPGYLAPVEADRLRYAFGLARLTVFAPGAALQQPGRADVTVAPDLVLPLRETLLERMKPALRDLPPAQRLAETARQLKTVLPLIEQTRSGLLERHCNDFSEAELDAEAGRKALVTAAGGGGGAGFVYIGAAARLRQEGRSSDYLVGSSIGALIGAFLARHRQLDIQAILNWAKGLSARQMFGRPRATPAYSLPGITRLHLAAMHEIFQREDGQAMRLSDMEIPYDPVISGVHARAYAHLPESLRKLTAVPDRGVSYARLLAERMLLLPTFISPQVTQAIPLGRDALSHQMRVVDAVGLSAAIPGVLQYLPHSRDAQSDAVLDALREAHRVSAFVDGGVSANVPARLAWEGVQAGRIGTRNAFILALDCFAPQRSPQHLWLWPVTQAIQMQLPAQRDYFDWLVSFSPTLSPINLLPSAVDFDRAFQWGWDAVDSLVPMLLKALEPVPWRP